MVGCQEQLQNTQCVGCSWLVVVHGCTGCLLQNFRLVGSACCWYCQQWGWGLVQLMLTRYAQSSHYITHMCVIPTLPAFCWHNLAAARPVLSLQTLSTSNPPLLVCSSTSCLGTTVWAALWHALRQYCCVEHTLALPLHTSFTDCLYYMCHI